MKNKFTELIGKAQAHPESKRIMTHFFEELGEVLGEMPEVYWDLTLELYEEINGPYFDEELSAYAVSGMENEDGTTGGHWTLEQTNDMAKDVGVSVNEYDWYYVLNMIYSDFCGTIKNNTPMYPMLAKDWIMDKDAPDGKAFSYYKMVAK